MRTLSGQRPRVSERFEQLLRIGRDAEEPLRKRALLDRRTGAPTLAVDHLLVGEYRLVHRIPVDDRFSSIGEIGFKEIDEHPLLVRVIAGMAGGDLTVPVERQPHGLELAAHRRDVVVGPLGGMDLALHRRVLRRQAESVPTHRMDNVETLGAFVPRHHVAHGVIADVAHMDAPRWIGEHLQDIVFRTIGGVSDLERSPIVPGFLPLLLNLAEIIP